MTRRELFASLAALVPGAAVRVEPLPTSSDLVVVTCDTYLADEDAAEIGRMIQSAIGPGPRVLVLEHGMSVQIHRGVARMARVEMQEGLR